MVKKRIKRAISKSIKQPKNSKLLSTPKSKEMDDLLPPPPPGFFEKKARSQPKLNLPSIKLPINKPEHQKQTKPEQPNNSFKPSPHELHRIILTLKRDINAIVINEKFLHIKEEKLLKYPVDKMLKVLDTLKDDLRYEKELKDIEKKVTNYDSINNKGWLTDKKVSEARALLNAYKTDASEKREEIIDHLTAIRKQKEKLDLQQKEIQKQKEHDSLIRSIDKPQPKQVPKPEPILKKKEKPETKPLLKPKEAKAIQKPRFLLFSRKPKTKEQIKQTAIKEKNIKLTKVKEIKVKEPKVKEPSNLEVSELPPPPKQEAPSHHELRKHVFHLKDSLQFLYHHEPFFKNIDEKLHSLPKLSLKRALERLNYAKKHVEKASEIQDEVALQSSKNQGWLANSKLNKAKTLIDIHKIDLDKHKETITDRIDKVQSKIKEKEKEEKNNKEKQAIIQEEKKELLPKLSKLKSHLNFIRSKSPLLNLDGAKVSHMPQITLSHAISDLSSVVDYLKEVQDIEEHFVAATSKKNAVTADKHLKDARNMIATYKIDLESDLQSAKDNLSLLKSHLSSLDKQKKKSQQEKQIILKERETIMPKVSLLKNHLNFIKSNKKMLYLDDSEIVKIPAWRINPTLSKLNHLKKYILEVEDIEDHLVAESSKQDSITAETHLNNARALINEYNLNLKEDIKLVKKQISSINKLMEIKQDKAEEIKNAKKVIAPIPPKKLKVTKKEDLKVPIPSFEKPKPELISLMSEIRKSFRIIERNEKLLVLDDLAIIHMPRWRIPGVVKNLEMLKNQLIRLDGLEHDFAAEKSKPQNLIAEKQIEEIQKIMDKISFDPKEKSKIADSKIDELLDHIKPTKDESRKEELSMPKLSAKEPVIPPPPPSLKKPSVSKIPELKLPSFISKGTKPLPTQQILNPQIIKRPDREVNIMIAKFKKAIKVFARSKKFLDLTEPSLRTMSPRALKNLKEEYSFLSEVLDKLQDMEEHIIAESSKKETHIPDSQLETARNLTSQIDIDSYRKIVSPKLRLVESLLSPQVSIPIPKALPRSIPHSEIPEFKPNVPEHFQSQIGQKVNLPIQKSPSVKPSMKELNQVISGLKRDLNYIASHEKLLHLSDEQIIKMNHTKFDQVFNQLKHEEEYLNDLGDAETIVSKYSSFPLKGSPLKKINEAKKLLSAYKSHDVNVTRAHLINRMDMMKRRKIAFEKDAEEERTSLRRSIDERKKSAIIDQRSMIDIESKMMDYEDRTFEELANDQRSLDILKSAEQESINKKSAMPKPSVIFKEPQALKPALERHEIQKLKAQQEVNEAIQAAKQPLPKDKLSYAMDQIGKARKALEDLDVQTAKQIYLEVHGVYKEMKPLEQYRVYEALKDLYEERRQAEQLVA